MDLLGIFFQPGNQLEVVFTHLQLGVCNENSEELIQPLVDGKVSLEKVQLESQSGPCRPSSTLCKRIADLEVVSLKVKLMESFLTS